MNHLRASASAAVAALAFAATPLAAQSVTSSTGTTSSVSGIQSAVSSQEMSGMRVSATLANGMTGSAVWGSFAGGWGVDIFSGQVQIARVAMNPGTADTYFGDWLVTLYDTSNLTNLTFEGGAAYGGVLFDRCAGFGNSNCAFGGSEGTAGSDIGNDVAMNNLRWRGISAEYTNAVMLGANAPVNDLFAAVSIDFTNAEWCEPDGLGAIICVFGFGFNSDVPDVGGPNDNPFGFRMDTDLGEFSTVPEPSTYILMAAGLAGLGVAARRRRRTA